MAEHPIVSLSLANRPENLLVVRQALTGVANGLAFDALAANDLNTAVSEACNNVVMHAYEGAEGPLVVEVCALADAVAVIVRDHGCGMATGAQATGAGGDAEDHAGIGLPVISALARRVDFSDVAGGGTAVRMEFAAPNAGSLGTLGEDRSESSKRTADAHADSVELRLAPSPLARAVLARVLGTLAARVHFSTDRISDVQMLADVLAANAADSIDGSDLNVGVRLSPHALALRLWPLRSGGGESLLNSDTDGFAPIIERLTDERRVARAGAGEALELRLVDHPWDDNRWGLRLPPAG